MNKILHFYDIETTGSENQCPIQIGIVHVLDEWIFKSIHLKENFLQIRNTFATPEEINDSPQTAPSKRIKSLIASYEKPLMGTLGALEIGLLKIRKECKLFDAWLSNLESIPPKEI